MKNLKSFVLAVLSLTLAPDGSAVSPTGQASDSASDGRVVATGGAGLTTNRSFAGDDSSIEAYEPPYLFRGVRPRIDSVSTTDLTLGSNFTTRVSLTNAVTKLVLVSARTATHWVNGGPQRYLTLDATQNGSDLSMGVLVGDTTGDGSVNTSDIGQVKAESGRPVTASNFRSDVTANGGTINSSDIGLVKSQSRRQLP